MGVGKPIGRQSAGQFCSPSPLGTAHPPFIAGHNSAVDGLCEAASTRPSVVAAAFGRGPSLRFLETGKKGVPGLLAGSFVRGSAGAAEIIWIRRWSRAEVIFLPREQVYRRLADLIEALRSGHLGGAALDVFEKEPPDAARLRDVPNLLLSPHMAYYSEDSLKESQHKAATQVVKFRVIPAEDPTKKAAGARARIRPPPA